MEYYDLPIEMRINIFDYAYDPKNVYHKLPMYLRVEQFEWLYLVV